MAGMIFFTDNYQDRSTNDGYQFEFYCRRCGNGYSSSFQHSVTGFGGRLLRLGGDLVGGAVGERAQQLGWDAEWMRDGVRGSTRDKALARAVEEMKPFFHQCHRCGQWVCEQVCWNGQRGLCTTCAPKLDQEIAGMQAAAQVNQLNDNLTAAHYTGLIASGVFLLTAVGGIVEAHLSFVPEFRDGVRKRAPSAEAPKLSVTPVFGALPGAAQVGIFGRF